MTTPACAHQRHADYPMYGPAPHDCFYKRGPGFSIGESVLKPSEEWPGNFVLELEPGERLEDVHYPEAMGVYYCPACRAGMPASRYVY